jgi:hypothetical protein
MNSIKKEFEKTEFKYDRIFEVEENLPYSLEYVIEPNELSYYHAFNMKLSKLYDNFLYIYSRCFFPNYEIPTTFTGFIGSSAGEIGIYQNTNFSEPFQSSGYPSIDSAKGAVVYKKENSYYLFINSLSAISVLRYDENYNFCQICPNIVTTVDPISGEIKFQKISGIKILNEKYLCVSDEILDVVYKYDLETYFLNENVFKSPFAPFGNKLFLLDSVGGKGSRYDTIKFQRPKNIETRENLVFVEDYDNKIFKLYNSNFDFISYQTFLNLYESVSSFNTFRFKDENTIYATTSGGYCVFDINPSNYRITFSYFRSLSSFLYSDEKVLDIAFPKYEKNIIYVLTNKGFIKKWKDIENGIIGRKNANEYGENSEFKWFSTYSKNLSTENIQIYTYNSTASSNQILLFEDGLDLISNLDKDDFLVYSKEDVYVKKNEWNQAWVYEKSFKKLYKNLEILNNRIKYSIAIKKGDFGSILDVKKIYNLFLINNDPVIDFKALNAVNENFQSSVLNRTISKIYENQLKSLNFVLLDNSLDYDNIGDTPTPTPTPTVTPTLTPFFTPSTTPTVTPTLGFTSTPTPTPTLTPTPTRTPSLGTNISTFDGNDIVDFNLNTIQLFS